MKKIIIALFVTMLLFSANTVVEAKGQKDFKKFRKEFQTAVKKKNKKQILSMTNDKFFSYGDRDGSCDIIPKSKFFKVDEENSFWGPGAGMLDPKNPVRKKILSSKTHRVYKAKEDQYFEDTVYKEMPNIKNKKLYIIDLLPSDYGVQCLIFVKTNGSYLLLGEIYSTMD